MDDTVDNVGGSVGALGMEDGCARKPHCCTGVWTVSAQRHAQRRHVTDVTGVREVFSKEFVRKGRNQRLDRCRMRVVSSLT